MQEKTARGRRDFCEGRSKGGASEGAAFLPWQSGLVSAGLLGLLRFQPLAPCFQAPFQVPQQRFVQCFCFRLHVLTQRSIRRQ